MAKETNKHYLIGINPISNLLQQNPDRCLQLFLHDSEKLNSRLQEIERLAMQHHIAISRHGKAFFQKFSGTHQGVAAQTKAPKVLRDAELDAWLTNTIEIEKIPLLLVLDQIQDPHNLGAILRTADAAGVDAVIVSNNNTAPINATVSKIASGAAESATIFRVSNIARTIDKLKQQGIWVAGTSDQASSTLYANDLSGPLALVMGAEGSGMRQLTQQKCDYLVKLPMQGVVSSLNVSVATGICLYEINRQRSSASS